MKQLWLKLLSRIGLTTLAFMRQELKERDAIIASVKDDLRTLIENPDTVDAAIIKLHHTINTQLNNAIWQGSYENNPT